MILSSINDYNYHVILKIRLNLSINFIDDFDIFDL